MNFLRDNTSIQKLSSQDFIKRKEIELKKKGINLSLFHPSINRLSESNQKSTNLTQNFKKVQSIQTVKNSVQKTQSTKNSVQKSFNQNQLNNSSDTSSGKSNQDLFNNISLSDITKNSEKIKKKSKSKPITQFSQSSISLYNKTEIVSKKRGRQEMGVSNPDSPTFSTSTNPPSDKENYQDEEFDRHNGKKRKIQSEIEMILDFPLGKQTELTIEETDTFKIISNAITTLAQEDKKAYKLLAFMNPDKYYFMARGPQAFEKSYDFNDNQLVLNEYNNWPQGTRLAVEEKIIENEIQDSSIPNGNSESLIIEEIQLHISFELNGVVTGAKDLENRILENSFDKKDTLYSVSEFIYEKTGVDSFYLIVNNYELKDIKKYSKTEIQAFINNEEKVLNIIAVIDPTIDIQTINFSEIELEDYEYKEYASVLYRAKYIPLRPTLNERHNLEMLISLLSVADYTTDVDGITDSSELTKPALIKKRMMKQIRHINGFLTGNALSVNFDKGSELATNKESASKYAAHFRKVFELGRRHKIRNPEKMKVEYGKMMYMLQDARSSQIMEQLGFDIITGVKSVFDVLSKADALGVLEDSMIETATKDIIDEGQSRTTLEKIKKDKYKNIDRIARSFRNRSIDEEQIKTCLYSIVDANCYLNQCARPIDIMLKYLQTYFSPTKESYGKYPEFSCLSINEGHSGARLTHSHSRQYQFVLQSLTLWRTIIGDMYRLWYLAEEDILDMKQSPYELKNTGQGFQRVQNSPRVYKAMLGILDHVKKKIGRENWIGASRIHVGDNNVPNALLFIDKYNAVPKIISTIVCVLENIKKICDENRGIRTYIENAFGGSEKATVMILQDFFKHAFDGSGAETFDSAGSCIDGRLTAAWNWTHQIASKEYYPLFQLTGFTSFENAGNT